MSLQSLKRWHWIFISLVVGLLLGFIRYSAIDPDLDRRGSMTQRAFEQAVARQKVATDAGNRTRAIHDTVVVTRIEDPRSRRERSKNRLAPRFYAYKVDVQHWTGARTDIKRVADGQAEITTRPQMFIATIPYHPGGGAKPVEPQFTPSKLQRLAETLRIRTPEAPSTVLDYLAQVAEPSGITFTYRWYNELKVQMAGWTLASFVCIGLVWPTLVNLMYFGSFWRPREEKGIDLSKVSSRSPETRPATVVSDEEHDKLAALEAELQAKLGGFGQDTISTRGPGSSGFEAEPPPPVRPLTEAPPLEVVETDAEREAREFKQKDDDFYPTERRGKPKD
jgi:hypothetical protein